MPSSKATPSLSQFDKSFDYKLVFDSSPEVMILLNSQSVVLQVNDRIYDFLGYRPQDIIGKKLAELPFFNPESKSIIKTNFALRVSGKNVPEYEVEFKHKNGQIVSGLVRAAVVKDKSGNLVKDLLIISDITEIKKSKLILQEKVADMEKMNRLMIGRELKMVELKELLKKYEK